jgi:alpha/beta superfamily hydrolase
LTPFHFGGSAEPLFGIVHPALHERPDPRGALLCAPILYEYMAAHRSLRQLANRLAQAGIAALRFDWYGTGDSAGEAADGGPARWGRDLEAARVELRGHHATPPSVVGLRFGAALALQRQISRDAAEIPALVLWEPVLDGAAYVEELLERQRDLYGEITDEVLGCPFGAALRGEIAALDLRSAPPPRAGRVLIVESSEMESGRRALVDRWCDAGARAEHRVVPGPPFWQDPGKTVVPMQAIQAIVSWMGRP